MTAGPGLYGVRVRPKTLRRKTLRRRRTKQDSTARKIYGVKKRTLRREILLFFYFSLIFFTQATLEICHDDVRGEVTKTGLDFERLVVKFFILVCETDVDTGEGPGVPIFIIWNLSVDREHLVKSWGED